MFKIYHRVIQEICGHAVKAYPRECCGILLGNKEGQLVKEIRQTGNADTADRQQMHFLIHPLELYRAETEAEKADMEIVGFYHSHADAPAVPSREDASSMLPGYLYMIVSVEDGACMEWKGYGTTGLLGEIHEIKTGSD